MRWQPGTLVMQCAGIARRRVQCVPPKPMVISVDNNGGQGAWLRLFIEVSFPIALIGCFL